MGSHCLIADQKCDRVLVSQAILDQFQRETPQGKIVFSIEEATLAAGSGLQHNQKNVSWIGQRS
jgi:hypothetical protein